MAGAVFSQGWHFLKKTCFWSKIFTKSTILGAKMVPNVVKNATQNRYGFWVRFLIPFGSILSPFWGLKVGGCRSNFHLKWSLCSLRWSLASLGCHFGALFDKSGRCSPIFIKNGGNLDKNRRCFANFCSCFALFFVHCHSAGNALPAAAEWAKPTEYIRKSTNTYIR